VYVVARALKKKNIEIHLVSVNKVTYEEFIKSIPAPSLIWNIKERTACRPIVAEVDPSLFSSLFNKFLLPVKEIKTIMPDVKYITKQFRDNWNRNIN